MKNGIAIFVLVLALSGLIGISLYFNYASKKLEDSVNLRQNGTQPAFHLPLFSEKYPEIDPRIARLMDDLEIRGKAELVKSNLFLGDDVLRTNSITALTCELTNSSWVIQNLADEILRSYLKGEGYVGGTGTGIYPDFISVEFPKISLRSVIPDLITHLQHNDWVVRMQAVDLLNAIHEEPELVVPALTKVLEDDHPSVRASAVLTLGRFGEQAGESFGRIIKLANDPNQPEVVHYFSVVAAYKIDAEATKRELKLFH